MDDVGKGRPWQRGKLVTTVAALLSIIQGVVFLVNAPGAGSGFYIILNTAGSMIFILAGVGLFKNLQEGALTGIGIGGLSLGYDSAVLLTGTAPGGPIGYYAYVGASASMIVLILFRFPKAPDPDLSSWHNPSPRRVRSAIVFGVGFGIFVGLLFTPLLVRLATIGGMIMLASLILVPIVWKVTGWMEKTTLNRWLLGVQTGFAGTFGVMYVFALILGLR